MDNIWPDLLQLFRLAFFTMKLIVLTKLLLVVGGVSPNFNWILKVHFVILTWFFLWHFSVGIDKISLGLFQNFQLILSFSLLFMHVLYRNVASIGHYSGNFHVDIINRQFGRLSHQTNEFASNILHTKIMYLKGSADVKMSTFFEKYGRWGCGSRNGPLMK